MDLNYVVTQGNAAQVRAAIGELQENGAEWIVTEEQPEGFALQDWLEALQHRLDLLT